MPNLQTLRKRKKELRAEFELKKKAEWADLSSEVDAMIQLEINKMHKNGAKVSQIMREYGTSDRKTITDLLFVTPSAVSTVDPATLVWSNLNPETNTWEVTNGQHKATFVLLPDVKELVLISTTDPEFGGSVEYPENVEV